MELKAQSSIEYLSTYAWAILIIGIALAALYSSGVLGPASYGAGSGKCSISSDFYCLNATMSSTGSLMLIVGQSTSAPVYITTIACNSLIPPGNSVSYAYPGVFLPIGGNFTASVQCYSGSIPFSGKVGASYSGYLILTYNSIGTGFNQTIVGTVGARVSH